MRGLEQTPATKTCPVLESPEDMMKSLLVVAVVGALFCAAPAFAQDPGQPGATGTGNGLIGSNTGTGGATQMSGHRNMGGYSRHHHHHHHHRRY